MKVRASKDMLKMHLFNCIDQMDESAFAGFASIALIATGVTNGDGELTDDYVGETLEFTALELGIPTEEVQALMGKGLQAHMWLGRWTVTRVSIDAYKAAMSEGE